MDRTDPPAMRKRLMSEQGLRPPEIPGEIDIASRAMLAYSSEDPAHPVEHLIDGHYGRGSTHWASARINATERIVQESNFSPQGAIFQHEELRLELPAVTHLSLTIVPNKSGSGVATLTALRLFA